MRFYIIAPNSLLPLEPFIDVFDGFSEESSSARGGVSI